MLTDKEILTQIKTSIQEVLPDEKVFLLGRRARGDWHDESDWDILVLTEKRYPKSVKWKIHDKLFSLSVSIGTVFQFVVATEDEWVNAPELYILYKGVEDELRAL